MYDLQCTMYDVRFMMRALACTGARRSALYKESPIIANSDHLDKIDKSKRQKNIRRAFAEDHLDIVLVNFPVLITKTCKLDTILSKW